MDDDHYEEIDEDEMNQRFLMLRVATSSLAEALAETNEWQGKTPELIHQEFIRAAKMSLGIPF